MIFNVGRCMVQSERSVRGNRRAVLSPILLMLLTSACMPSAASQEVVPPVFQTDSESLAAAPRSSLHQARIGQGRTSGAQFLAAIEPILDADSPRLLGTALRSDAISAELNIASRRLKPSVALSGSSFSDGAALTISQPIFEFGKRSARLNRLKSQEIQQDLELADARQNLASQALSAALSHDLAVKWIALTQSRIADFRKAKTNAQRMLDLQLITQSDVQLVEVKLNEAMSDLTQAQNDLGSAQRSWARLAGQAPFPDAPLFPDLLNRFEAGNAEAAHRVAMDRNLDLRLLEAETAVQESEVAVVRTERAPTLSVQNVTSMKSDSSMNSRIGLGLEIDLFSPDRQAVIARSEGLSQALSADLANLKEDLSFEIERLLFEAQAADRLAQEKTRSVTALKDRVRALEGQIDQGLATFTDLIDARSDLFEVQYDSLELQNQAQLRQADVLLKTGVFAF